MTLKVFDVLIKASKGNFGALEYITRPFKAAHEWSDRHKFVKRA